MKRTMYVLLLLIVLAGCTSPAGPGIVAGAAGVTPTPSATADPSGYQAVASPACKVADWRTLQTDQPAGHLLAWQPYPAGTDSIDRLAYLAPDNLSSWYTGQLMLVEGPAFNEHRQLAPNLLTTGDLTWSPSGLTLAFLAFRPDENVYTVMTVAEDGSALTDLFPTDLARTDTRTSQKAIIGWKNDVTLQIMASCGEECRNAYDLRAGEAPGPLLKPTPVANYKDMLNYLTIQRKELEYNPDAVPKGFRSPHWSPDNHWVAFLDRRALLWVMSTRVREHFLIDIGLRDVDEVQWNPNSDMLAIRAEDRIFIFEVPCKIKP